jgi:hypothetical protein
MATLADEIWVTAEALHDIEAARIALDNRLRSTGLQSLDHNVMAADYQRLEIAWTKTLVSLVRQHPLHDWVKRSHGIGEKTTGRFLGIVPNPAWHDAEDRPRTLYELNAYCGLHVADGGEAPRHRRGEQSNWNSKAKTRLYVMAEPVLKHQGPLTDVYYTAKEKAAAAKHATLCAGCKSDAGSPLKPAHAHARAMRALMKEILRQMWQEMRNVDPDMLRIAA